uniref:(northern house mosquito) hypothetical protein n=1 Tax=Culex pipiens TaxID=7175 RepID=A0A8D8AUP1_CULPI
MVKTEHDDQVLEALGNAGGIFIIRLRRSTKNKCQTNDEFEDRTVSVLMDACNETLADSKPTYEKKIPIYLTSGFYNDFNGYLLGTHNNEQFIIKMCKQLISYCP